MNNEIEYLEVPSRGPTAPQNPPLWDFAQSLDSEKLAYPCGELWSPQTGSDLTAAWRRDASMPPLESKSTCESIFGPPAGYAASGRQTALRPRSGGGHAPMLPTRRRSGRRCSPRPRRLTLMLRAGPFYPTVALFHVSLTLRKILKRRAAESPTSRSACLPVSRIVLTHP